MMTQRLNRICRALMPRRGVAERDTDGDDRGKGKKKEADQKRKREPSESKGAALDCFTENSLLLSAMRRDAVIILLCITRTHNRRLLAAFME